MKSIHFWMLTPWKRIFVTAVVALSTTTLRRSSQLLFSITRREINSMKTREVETYLAARCTHNDFVVHQSVDSSMERELVTFGYTVMGHLVC